MANPDALAIVQAAVGLSRSHARAPPLDVLDVVMKGRQGVVLNFIEVGVRHASLADPASPFGQLVAAALDKGMSPAEWVTFTSDTADPILRSTCLDIWRDDIFCARFEQRYGVTVQGLP